MKLFSICVLCALAAASQADITFTAGNHPQVDENVQFNDPGLLMSGALVQGDTNMTSTIIDFYGAGEDLTTPNSGQARIEAADGGLTDLTMAVHAGQAYDSFTSIILNLNASKDGQVTLTANDGTTDFSSTFNIDKNGQNFFTITAINGETIKTFSLSSTVDLSDVRQVRVGVAQAVPEPASMAALGLGALGILKRRKKA